MDYSQYKNAVSSQKGLYLLSKNNNDSNLKNYYKALCKSLSNNITKAKCSYYNKLLCNSNNKISATWKIVKTETGRTHKWRYNHN